MTESEPEIVLEIQDLGISYITKQGKVKAAENVSFKIHCGEFVGLSGESGCGKTTTALALMHLLPKEGIIESGKIFFKGRNILEFTKSEILEYLWRDISMIFQGAMNALNPVHKVIDQMTTAIRIHENVSEEEARERSLELIESVGIDISRADGYPHEMSGGMKQRLMIALALVCHPSLVIADEPTTALDVMVQAQILDLMNHLRDRTNLSLLLITHDLSVIAETCDYAIIMYAGRIAEMGSIKTIFSNPEHPYTMKLISSFPSILSEKGIDFIPGNPPDLINPPSGCRYHERCDYVIDKCRQEVPPLVDEEGHMVACWRRHDI
ncbi:MAG: dipeptide/oligopeptide/nickel ABC transporter ATP-binding protein [Candidatus Thorarchaeota archaeon SMTZ-45]|nr:MAG: dipeptide/oligopeptide/nickel ABC transporter ATP-binding protein [Candidatus Thorarchaeota archaeon SMTZ1-45]KXH70678.1 MAG: dipeptide/oligopeptide/nickel ABC transporter ATP-binding protein [Candidatus Thorarchaeota archaeon SMTZ-45]